MTTEDLAEFKKNHEASWRTFFKIYPIKKNLLKSRTFRLAVIINFIIALAIPFADNTFVILKEFVDIILVVFPSLLGFSIGAYALLTGIFSERILTRIIKEDKLTKINLFQITSATFGAALLVLSLTLILSFFIKQIIVIGVLTAIPVSVAFEVGFNTLITFVINLFASYSILLLINIIKNIFGLNQFISSLTSIDVIQASKEREKGHS